MKKNHLIAKFIFLILLFAGGAVFSQETEKTVINIENARNTKYEKDKSTGNDLIILTGNVKVSVSRGSTKNVISADSIRYDRTSEMMYAEGNVSLEQTTANAGSQNVSASSLMFNTSTLEGVFDDGRVVQVKSDAINLPAGSTLIVASDIFGRSESNTITFKNGELTFCDDEDPHWRIKASRIWLLPGGEFAFLNARLFVGPVPIFYLPAFYYPKDELIFNPVFGYEKRRGYFIETTSYLYGRKPLETTSNTSSTDSDSSEKLKALFNFVKPSSLKEQRIEGLMMHNLDDDYKGNTTNYFKILGDYYSNLGFLVGFDGVFKPKKYISSLEMSANLGFSNTIFKDSSGNYLPFSPGGDRIYDKSNLLGFELPFRYSGKFKMSMSSPFTLNISLPVYSDPYFSNDFTKDRSETMDWISFLIDSQNTDEDNTTTTTDSSFNWTVSGSYSVPLPQVIKPFLNSMSLSLNSSVAFSSISIKSEKLENSKVDSSSLSAWKSSTPERMFFYPSQVIPMSLSGTISGTLIDISTSKTKTASKNKKDVSFAVPMITPDDILPLNERKNKEKTETESQNSENQNENAENGENNAPDVAENETEPLLPDSALPVLTGISANVTDFSGISYSMKYSIKPSLSTQISYNSSNLDTPGDFDWSVLKSSMYKLSVPITLDNNFSYSGSFFSISNSNTFNPVRQRHPYLHMNEKDESGNEIEKIWYSDPSAKSIKKADYGTDKLDLTQTNSVALKPFNYIKFIKDTGITWRSSIKLVRTEFLSDEYEKTGETEWDYHFVDWTDENSITTNALDFTFATNQMDSKFSQSLTLSTTLKPLAESYYSTLKLGFPLTTLAFETGVKKASTDDNAEWVRQPLKQSLTVSGKVLGSSMSFSENYNYNMDEYHHDSMKFSFSWMNLTAAYQMSYTYGYDMKYDETSGEPTGWEQRADKEFLPYNFSFTYSPKTKTIYRWKNRVSMGMGLSTSVVADLLKPTSSYFTFAPSVSFKISEFVNFTFSASTRNSVIYRYFGNDIGLAGEENMFVDLANSFRFDNEELRKSSGFKLKSLNFSLTHELHDWDFNATFKIEPRLLTDDKNQKYYDFNPYMTINITWRPMGAMKTEIVDNYGEWELK
ncbi:MAG: hypothetical protein UIB61_11225 [Treponema sp.]|nr:hypothetical protein [Treponema sp.]